MVDRAAFLETYSGVFEHSQWVAERAFESGAIADPLTGAAVHAAMCEAFRGATRDERMAVLCAHPDLAGKLAVAGELTEDSWQEQAGAGLDRLSADEHTEFTRLNNHYMKHFDFPFVIAVKGLGKNDILTAFRTRIANSADEEFSTACGQVEKIARLRLEALLPQS